MIVDTVRTIAEVECFKCGVLWYVSSDLHSNWKRDKATFFCPNGHDQHYTKSTADLLTEELATMKEEIGRKDRDIVTLTRSLKRLKNPPKKVVQRKKN